MPRIFKEIAGLSLAAASTMQEWLITDQRGGFAMGTPAGVRSRKYHGFYLGLAGRSEIAWLSDIALEVDGESLWPHSWEPKSLVFAQDPWPRWEWSLPSGTLHFQVSPRGSGGMRLGFQWKSGNSPRSSKLGLRLFFALRELHAMGGQPWSWEPVDENQIRISTPSGPELRCALQGPWKWKDEPLWYRNFHYSEESERGYPSEEDLFSAGSLEAGLGLDSEWAIHLSDDPQDLSLDLSNVPRERPTAIDEFILKRPAGIAAGFPWFGEWGRDTFVSLPGVVAGWAGGDPGEVWDWTHEVLSRWGEWIQRVGMLPNLIEKEGTHQWESADATLWWCHSLASLWQISSETGPESLKESFYPLLGQAIASIREGRHLFLRLSEDDGLLEVTEPHTTWMDARWEGAPVTPRSGKLPEINALWFQAQCLHALWSPHASEADFTALERLGQAALFGTEEQERPNRIFLHSLPLAPSFVLNEFEILNHDLVEIEQKLWTPLGLRTLSPMHPRYHARCAGIQRERDYAYHQGAVWAWLGGHFEMAKLRLKSNSESSRLMNSEKTLTEDRLREMPIPGHVAEIFDAEEPFTPRGTPAQAWSLACLKEFEIRKRLRLDSKLTRILSQRWLGRTARNSRKRKAV